MKNHPFFTSHRRLLAAACFCAWLVVPALGQEGPRPEMMRERAADLERKAAELKADGRHDEARKLMQEVEELRLRGKRFQAEPMRPGRPGAGPQMGDFQRRLQHLQVAIENLHAAGLHQPAERLAMARERLLRERPERGEFGPGPQRPEGPKPMMGELEQMRQEMKKLAKAVKDLQRRLENLEEGAEKKR